MSELRLITSDYLSRFPRVGFGMSTRLGGVSPEPFGMNLSLRVGDDRKNVEENCSIFFRSLGLEHHGIALPHQSHSDNIQVVTQAGEFESCDGTITGSTNLPLVVTIADCVPIALFEPTKQIIGLVHAGWRGTARTIVSKAIEIMKESFGASPAEIVAFLGPSAGGCCYEVGPEVAEAFSEIHLEHRGKAMFLDLKRANVDQLLGSGLNPQNIEASEFCTICNPSLFHSHRRDKDRSGRMMAVIVLKKE
jgi:YfiH family protein